MSRNLLIWALEVYTWLLTIICSTKILQFAQLHLPSIDTSRNPNRNIVATLHMLLIPIPSLARPIQLSQDFMPEILRNLLKLALCPLLQSVPELVKPT
jgi:hypothetical protein